MWQDVEDKSDGMYVQIYVYVLCMCTGVYICVYMYVCVRVCVFVRVVGCVYVWKECGEEECDQNDKCVVCVKYS